MKGARVPISLPARVAERLQILRVEYGSYGRAIEALLDAFEVKHTRHRVSSIIEQIEALGVPSGKIKDYLYTMAVHKDQELVVKVEPVREVLDLES
jgi:hypothetical protein